MVSSIAPAIHDVTDPDAAIAELASMRDSACMKAHVVVEQRGRDMSRTGRRHIVLSPGMSRKYARRIRAL